MNLRRPYSVPGDRLMTRVLWTLFGFVLGVFGGLVVGALLVWRSEMGPTWAILVAPVLGGILGFRAGGPKATL